MSIFIRNEESADVDVIKQVILEAFLEHPNSQHNEQSIVNALRKAGVLTASLVAEQGDLVVGHLALSPVTISDGSTGWYAIGPLSVIPRNQGLGVGTRLMERALAVLEEHCAAGCVVLGPPEYYGRFGFQHDAELRFNGQDNEHFQALLIGGAMPSGTVSYHKAFARKK